MTWSRKTYERVARIIRESGQCATLHDHPGKYREGTADTLDHLARRLADEFAADNAAFDRERFIAACALPDVYVHGPREYPLESDVYVEGTAA